MYHLERKRDEDKKRSEAVWHFIERQGMEEEKLPENYQPHWSEKDEQNRPRDMLNMGNSYGNVSVAANRKKEMLLTVSEKRRHNSETLDNDHKRLNGKRRRNVADPYGWAFTNSFNPVDSAFAFKTKKRQPARRILARIKQYVNTKGQDTVELTLPFLSLERDKNRLQRLINETGGAVNRDKDLRKLEREKERLSREVLQKEQMQRQFLKKLELSITRAKMLAGAEGPAWLTATTIAEVIGIADPDPAAEEDKRTEGLTGAAPKTKRNKPEKNNNIQ